MAPITTKANRNREEERKGHEFGQMWLGCRAMLDVVQEQGIEIPPELIAKVIALDTILVKNGIDPVARITGTKPGASLLDRPDGAPPQAPPEQGSAGTQSAAQLYHEVFAALSKLIRPANAITVFSTDGRAPNPPFWASLPPLLKFAGITAVVSAMVFVVSAGMMAQLAPPTANPASAQSPTPDAGAGNPAAAADASAPVTTPPKVTP